MCVILGCIAQVCMLAAVLCESPAILESIILVTSDCQSVRPSTWNNSVYIGMIFMELGI